MSNRKFKVGDVVRLVRTTSTGWYPQTKYKMGEVFVIATEWEVSDDNGGQCVAKAGAGQGVFCNMVEYATKLGKALL